MLMCSQLKLSERRSVPKFKSDIIHGDSIIVRPCTQRNITEVPQKITVHHVNEKRSPELRVVSLHLEDRPDSTSDRKIAKAPIRMPLFCEHFKNLQKNYQRHKKDIDENFVVRGFEVGSANLALTNSNSVQNENYCDPDEDDLNFLRSGIQIQLTDCCQCVCDLFNSNFPIWHNDDYETIENSNSMRSFRPKEDVVSNNINDDRGGIGDRQSVETQSKGILDPNILKVIRVTMNTKH